MKDKIIISATRNIKWVFFAQLIVFLLGIFKSIILPKYLGVEDFGYWQIYLFYVSYVGLFAFGFNDGIYLRYGKYQYSELPHKKLRSAIKLYTAGLVAITIIMIVLSTLEKDLIKMWALILVSVNIGIVGLYGVYIFIYQITNQMKKYSFFSVLDKILLIISLILLLALNERNYISIILVDIVSKVITVVLMIFSCKELWFGELDSFKNTLDEMSINIKVGMPLMIANLMGMLVTGIGRFIVERCGSIKEYAYYSFGMSVTSLVLIMITSVSMVVYPTLKRLPEENYNKYFDKMNNLVSVFNVTALGSYFIAYIFVGVFLPDYRPMLTYLNLLFGVVILQSKMQLLNNTFYKALREEKAMFKANMSSVILFSITASVLFTMTKSIWIIAFTTFITMLFRCYASEHYLRKCMNIKVTKVTTLEIIFLGSFIILTSLTGIYNSIVLFLLIYTGYIFLNRNIIKELVNQKR